jgi:hypothetical protein
MQKSLIPKERVAAADEGWINLENLVRAELTSEDASHPIEAALQQGTGNGWRASEPGHQTIRLLFSEPVRVKRIHLEFQEHELPRTQEFSLRWSGAGISYKEIVRQQFNFDPPQTSQELENYEVDLVGLAMLELNIAPDINHHGAHASLAALRLA